MYVQRTEVHFDFVVLWSAGRALSRGLDPYDADEIASLQSAVGYGPEFYSPFYYPLWTGLLYVPLGLLPLSWAAAVWLTANQAMLLAAIWDAARGMRWQPSSTFLGLTVFACLVFHPTMVTFLNGQMAIGTLFLFSVVFASWHSEGRNARCLGMGAVLALTMVKPQLALTTLPALLTLLVVQHRWLGVIGFVVMATMMFGISELLSPGWLFVWVRARARQAASSYAVPSVWGAAYDLWPGHWVALAVVVCVALLVWLVTLWWRHREKDLPGPLIAVTIIVGQLISPFLWVYDQTVLLFAFIVGMACAHSQPRPTVWRVLLMGWVIVLPYLLYAWANLRNRATGNVLLPVVLAMLLLSMSWKQLYLPRRQR